MINDEQAEKWLMEQWYGGRSGTITGPADAARHEGWDIFDCSGSSYGRWQINRIDEPSEGHAAIEEDGEAWKLVLEGAGEHHIQARAFIRQFEPIHWMEICSKAKVVGVDLSKLPDGLVVECVTAAFTYVEPES